MRISNRSSMCWLLDPFSCEKWTDERDYFKWRLLLHHEENRKRHFKHLPPEQKQQMIQMNRKQRKSYFEMMRGVTCRFWRRRGKQSVPVKGWAHFSLQEREIMEKGEEFRKRKGRVYLPSVKGTQRTKGEYERCYKMKWNTGLGSGWTGWCCTLSEGGELGWASGLGSSLRKKGWRLGGADTGWLDCWTTGVSKCSAVFCTCGRDLGWLYTPVPSSLTCHNWTWLVCYH